MESKSNKLQAKDLINVGIFTAIYFVIFFAGMMLGYIPIFIPLQRYLPGSDAEYHPSCLPSHLLQQYGEVRYESKDAPVSDGA